MWNYFKNRKAKREQDRLLAEQKVDALRAELNMIDEKVSTISSDYYRKEIDERTKSDSTCPRCKSRNVNDRIKRQQGYLDGEISGSSWSALTFGSGSLSGSIRGELDTNEVNKCNDCEHEWKKYKTSYQSSRDIFDDKLDDVRYLLQLHYDANNCKFDALDLEEKYNSFEEKKEALTKLANNSFRFDRVRKFWNGVSIDAFNVLAKKYYCTWDYENLMKYYDEELLVSFGFKKL